MKRQKGKR